MSGRRSSELASITGARDAQEERALTQGVSMRGRHSSHHGSAHTGLGACVPGSGVARGNGGRDGVGSAIGPIIE